MSNIAGDHERTIPKTLNVSSYGAPISTNQKPYVSSGQICGSGLVGADPVEKAMGIPWLLWPVLPGISQIRRTLKPSFRPWSDWKVARDVPGWTSEARSMVWVERHGKTVKEKRTDIYIYILYISYIYIAITKQTDVKVLPGWYRRCFPCTTSCMCPTFLFIWVYYVRCRLSFLEHSLFPQDFIRKLDPFGPIWEYCLRVFTTYGYGSIPIDTFFRAMSTHLQAILMSTRGIGFWPRPI